MDGKNDNFDSKNLGYFVQKDRATQMQEALYYLQTEIDSVKESAAKSVDVVEELRLLQGEVSNLTDVCRADLYALNDKIESSIREQSRNSINLSEEFKKLSRDEKNEIAVLCKELKEKTENSFNELALSMSKLCELFAEKQDSDVNKNLSDISEKLDCLFDAIAAINDTSDNSKDEKLDAVLIKLSAIEENLVKTDNSNIEERLEKLEIETQKRAEENAAILRKLDELLERNGDNQIDNSENAIVVSSNISENEASNIANMIAKLSEKIDRLEERPQSSDIDAIATETMAENALIERIDKVLCALENGDSMREESALADNDDVMRMLEKLNNQITVLLSDNQDKISEIKDELDRFKDNFTTVTGGGVSESEDDLKKSFESLSSELDTLSRLINTEKSEEAIVPDAILSASDALSKVIDGMTENLGQNEETEENDELTKVEDRDSFETEDEPTFDENEYVDENNVADFVAEETLDGFEGENDIEE